MCLSIQGKSENGSLMIGFQLPARTMGSIVGEAVLLGTPRPWLCRHRLRGFGLWPWALPSYSSKWRIKEEGTSLFEVPLLLVGLGVLRHLFRTFYKSLKQSCTHSFSFRTMFLQFLHLTSFENGTVFSLIFRHKMLDL